MTSSQSSTSCVSSALIAPADRAEDDLALLLEIRLERVEALLVLDARHVYPNRPVT